MSPIITAAEVKSLALRLNNAFDFDEGTGYQVHLCVIDGAVHYEVAPVGYRLKEVVVETPTTDQRGAIQRRSYKHVGRGTSKEKSTQ